jgi:hypothetical protein
LAFVRDYFYTFAVVTKILLQFYESIKNPNGFYNKIKVSILNFFIKIGWLEWQIKCELLAWLNFAFLLM